MTDETQLCVVMTTVGSDEQARSVARSLVQRRLAACVQRLPIGSCYEWEAQLEEADEFLLLIKTTVARYPQLAAWVEEHHPYDEPELVMLPAGAAAPGYLTWVMANTRPPG